mgnify:CR=1 FL=1
MSEKLTPKENKKVIYGLIKIFIGAAIFIFAIYLMMDNQADKEQLQKEAAIETQNFINRGCTYKGEYIWSCPID